MYRVAIEKLYKWKENKNRKPLIIEGARQVGKTWLMREFGAQAYADTVYINFDSNSRMADLFAYDLDTDRLILGLELYAGRKINPDNTLLIFDEVQEVPRALSSLKYFYENAPQYHYCLRRFTFRNRFASRYIFSGRQSGSSEALSVILQGIFSSNRERTLCGAA